MRLLKRFFLSLFIFTNFLFAQGEGALPFTTLQQSPLLLGAGQIGAAIPNDDVLGFYFNPAILGYSARNNHASISIMPAKTKWFWSPLTYNNYGFNLGYNLKDSKIDLPISLGLGYIHNKFYYGKVGVTTHENPESIEKIENYDLFNNFSLGIGFNYLIKFNIGLSIKSFDSKLGGTNTTGNNEQFSAEGTMFDYGALLIVPVSNLLFNNTICQIDNTTMLKPTANFSLGYSLTNYGDEIYYVDEAQKDPLSRTARLGYTFDFGIDLLLEKTKINFLNYSFTAEANDILVNSRFTPEGTLVDNYEQYQSLLGDIKLADHLVNLESDNKVIVHKGHIFSLFDTFVLTVGSFRGRGYPSSRKTDGFGFTSNGLFKLLNKQIENPSIKYILNHFTIKYFKSNVEFIKNRKTTFDNLSIHFTGFEL